MESSLRHIISAPYCSTHFLAHCAGSLRTSAKGLLRVSGQSSGGTSQTSIATTGFWPGLPSKSIKGTHFEPPMVIVFVRVPPLSLVAPRVISLTPLDHLSATFGISIITQSPNTFIPKTNHKIDDGSLRPFDKLRTSLTHPTSLTFSCEKTNTTLTLTKPLIHYYNP